MPFDFEKYFFFLQRIGSRYYLIAGAIFFLFYVVLKNKILHKKIQSLFPKNTDYLREIFYSTITMLIFGFIPLFFIGNPAMRPHTTLYDNISDYGWAYYFLAYPIMFIMHDTYFYWISRIFR